MRDDLTTCINNLRRSVWVKISFIVKNNRQNLSSKTKKQKGFNLEAGSIAFSLIHQLDNMAAELPVQ